ncbi:MAG: DUF2269 family protein [Gammaproteobacteria bacterium]|nr:DUF2269 family protein [Gammaproteobacteria bacterium]
MNVPAPRQADEIAIDFTRDLDPGIGRPRAPLGYFATKTAAEAIARRQPLPAQYWRHARYRELLGYPAFLLGLVIDWLMIAKPTL